MGRQTRWSLLIPMGLLLLWGCTSIASGPELPRPAQAAGVAATIPPITSTTLDEATMMEGECPTVFCLVYHIDPTATWFDGTPVEAADFARTARAAMAPLSPAPDVYDSIVGLDVIDDLTLRVAFSRPVGDWQRLFERVLPPDDTDIVGASGVYHITEWVGGDRIVVERSDDWWSRLEPISERPLGSVERITFVFVDDPEDMVEALADGSVDVISARADQDLIDSLSEVEGVGMVLFPGEFWEHIDFRHDDPMLGQRWVRDAVDLAIDRQKILDRTVRLLDPGAVALDNTVWMGNTEHYEPHYAERHAPAAAEQILVDHGCARGDDVYVCGDRQLSFVWTSTNDDPARRVIFESAREDLAMVGIELLPDFRSPSAFVTRQHLFGGPDVWQMADFSWKAGVDPAPSDRTYHCDDSEFNVNRYCSAEVEGLVRSAGTTVDPDERAATFNEADRLYLSDLPLIPLFQKLDVMAWRSGLSGPAPNWSAQSNLWNVSAWTGMESIVVALDSEPLRLDPLSTDDPSANTVMSTLLYGAFGMDPTFHHVPVLVESVDVIES